MVKVRSATLDDIPALVDMGRMLHAESPRYARRSFNPNKVAARARLVIPFGGAHIAEREGDIVGMLAGFVVADWYGDDKIASDLAFYVKPEHRKKGRAALMLVRAFEDWAISQGATDLVPGSSTLIGTESTATFFEKLGYERTGYGFYKRVG